MKKCLISIAAICLFVPALQAQKLYVDSFKSNNRGWVVQEQDSLSIKVAEQSLQIDNRYLKRSVSQLLPFYYLAKEDFDLRFSLSCTGNPDNFGLGLYLNVDGDKYYYYICNTNHMIMMSRYRAAKKAEDYDLPWKAVDYVHQKDSDNLFRLVRLNGKMTFYMNGKQVGEALDEERAISCWGILTPRRSTLRLKNLTASPYPSVRNFLPIRSDGNLPKKENLGPKVNSEYDELRPTVSADGKTLFFFSDEKNPRSFGGQDIFYTLKQADGTWGEAMHADTPLNNNHANSVITVSSDNNTLLLIGAFVNQVTQKLSEFKPHYSRKRSDGKWSYPLELNVLNFQNKSSKSSYSISSNYKVMISSVTRDESYGGQDLYVSFSEDGINYSEPKNMGSVINTPFDEICPFLAPDNTTLYFSSFGQLGYGSADIFVTRRLDDTWKNWSQPENLGPGINTPEWDAYFSLDASGEYAYLSSIRDPKEEDGKCDIFRVKLPTGAKPVATVLIKGRVLDRKTNAPIATGITYSDLLEQKTLGIANSSAVDGSYVIVLPKGKSYQFLAEKEGFYAVSENIDLKKLSKYEEVERNLYLSPIEIGATVRLNNIFFETNKAILRPESKAELDRLVQFLQKQSKFKIEVSGHTDATGTDAINLPLSSDRAKAVYSYLMNTGIAADRLVYKGYGKNRPVAGNDTEKGKQLNRRVEFTILSDK